MAGCWRCYAEAGRRVFCEGNLRETYLTESVVDLDGVPEVHDAVQSSKHVPPEGYDWTDVQMCGKMLLYSRSLEVNHVHGDRINPQDHHFAPGEAG